MWEFLTKVLEIIGHPFVEYRKKRHRLRYWNEEAILMRRYSANITQIDPARIEFMRMEEDRVISVNENGLLKVLLAEGYEEIHRAPRKEIMPDKYIREMAENS
jgi:hypothetical protein